MRRKFDEKFKAKVKGGAGGAAKVSEVASRNKVHPNQIEVIV